MAVYTPVLIPLTLLLLLQQGGLINSADVITPPSHVFGYSGSGVNLTCLVSGDVSTDQFEWREYVSGTMGGVRIFSTGSPGQPPSSGYAIYGTYHLNIPSLTWKTNGGFYGCSVFSMSTPAEAHVFVFEPDHSMTALRMQVGEVHELTCEARFGATNDLLNNNLISTPEMTMDVRGNTLPSIKTEIFAKTSTDPYILRGRVNYTASKTDDAEDFGCNVNIDQPSATVRDTIEMDIQYTVERPIFMPVNEEMYVGEHINCTAPGNPEPTYVWNPITSPIQITFNGPTLMITDDMLGPNDWECVATKKKKVPTATLR